MVSCQKSSGYANVESGFSVNKDFLVENLNEGSVVAQRIVQDALLDAGEVLLVIVTKGMMQSVCAGRSRYDDALHRHKEATLNKIRKVQNENELPQNSNHSKPKA